MPKDNFTLLEKFKQDNVIVGKMDDLINWG